MESKEILEATASEPLTLENERKMQQSWREDEDKLTFIILLASDIEDGHSEIDSMIGKYYLVQTQNSLCKNGREK